MLIYRFASALDDVNVLALDFGGIWELGESFTVSKLQQLYVVHLIFAKVPCNPLAKILMRGAGDQNELIMVFELKGLLRPHERI